MTSEYISLPAPSRGSRTVPVSSKGQCIADLLVRDANGGERQLTAESWLERKFVRLFQCNPEVVEIVEQQPVVNYIDADGRNRKHTFDLLVTYADGRRVAFAIKPHRIAERIQLWDLVNLIAQQMSPRLADAACVLTERKIDPIDLHNAELMNVCRIGDPADDDAILEAVRPLIGAVPLAHLVETAGIGGRGYRAVLRLIAGGRLRALVHERINDHTLIAGVQS